MSPLRNACGDLPGLSFLVTGVGPVECAISLVRILERRPVGGVVLFGLGGAYEDAGTGVLDLCLAELEYAGDFGIAVDNTIEYFPDEVVRNPSRFDLRNALFRRVDNCLTSLGITYRSGAFVTVHSCTGTSARGSFLRERFDAICENMEGAAAARVCEMYDVAMVEFRCISNMVEKRDRSKWKIPEAIAKGSEILAEVIPQLLTAS